MGMETVFEKTIIEQPLYFRIGTKYSALIYQVQPISDGLVILRPWNKTTLISDFGKEFLEIIPKYDSHMENDSIPRAENLFYYSDFVKQKDYNPHKKTPATIYVLKNEQKFCRHVNIEDVIEKQHGFLTKENF